MRGAEPVLVESEDPDEGARSDPIQTLVLPLWRARWLIAVMLTAGAIVGLFLGIMQPNTYRSTGRLNLRPGAREAATPESLIAAALGGGGQVSDYMKTELAILRVGEVYERVARLVSPPALFSSYDPAGLDGPDTPEHIRLFHKAQAWWFTRGSSQSLEDVGHPIDDCPRCVRLAAEELEKSITLYNEGYNDPIIVVSFATHDPTLARRVVETFLQVCVDRHKEFYDTGKNLELAKERFDRAKGAMLAAEDELASYRDECGFMDLAAEKASLIARRDQLDITLAQEKERQLELEQIKELYEAKLAPLEPTITREVAQEPLVNVDRQKYIDREFELEQRLIEIPTTRGLDKDQIATQQKAIEELLVIVRERIAKEPMTKDRPPRLESAPNPDYVKYRDKLDGIEQELEELSASLVEEMRADVVARLDKANSCGSGYWAVVSEAEETRRSYDLARAQFDTAEEMHGIEASNLQVIDVTLPRNKEGPRRAKLLIVGLILGGLAGAALGFARHLLDKTVRSPADVQRKLGMQVVGVLPRRPLPRNLRRAMRRAAL